MSFQKHWALPELRTSPLVQDLSNTSTAIQSFSGTHSGLEKKSNKTPNKTEISFSRQELALTLHYLTASSEP